MEKEGLKLTYSMGSFDGVRESIKYEIGDVVWLYLISESCRKEFPNIKHFRRKVKIVKIYPSSDEKHFESYGVENIETGEYGSWYYPTFLEIVTDYS